MTKGKATEVKTDLRARAEARRKSRPNELAHTMGDAKRLMHELEVHKFELEIQNEELRAARAELEQGLERYTELFDFAPIGYAVVSPNGGIREINHAGARLFDRPRSRLVGANFAALLAAGNDKVLGRILEVALDSEKTEVAEIEIARSKGPIPVRLHAMALNREEPLLLLAFVDVSEEKLRESRLSQKQEQLREADRRKDEFLAMLSHELRTPLTSVRNSLFVLAGADPTGPVADRSRSIIDRQVNHLTRLVDDLLDVTRIAREKIRLLREPLDFAELVRSAIEDARPGFDANGIHLVADIDSGSLPMVADAGRLLQVVGNLLGNAEKFTPRGGTVTVKLTQDDTRARLVVRDTGVGVAPELLRDLFTPFVQAPQTLERGSGGLGLGLAMVKGLVELHGGAVVIDSDGAGRGTEVTVALPLGNVVAPRKEAAAPSSKKRRRVLVIEDNCDAADSLCDALTLRGHEVEVAYTGLEGIEKARAHRPEIVICDIGLPGTDGFAVAREFRTDTALEGTYLIALSGYAQPDDRRQAIDSGFNQHVAKPPRLDDLDRLLSNAPI